jgi:hypothetical protein
MTRTATFGMSTLLSPLYDFSTSLTPFILTGSLTDLPSRATLFCCYTTPSRTSVTGAALCLNLNGKELRWTLSKFSQPCQRFGCTEAPCYKHIPSLFQLCEYLLLFDDYGKAGQIPQDVAQTQAQHISSACSQKSSIAAFNPHLWLIVGEWSPASTDCATVCGRMTCGVESISLHVSLSVSERSRRRRSL